MTDEQVRTTIAVLDAYAKAELALDNDILDDLERAIEAAFNAMGPDGRDDDYETPLTSMW